MDTTSASGALGAPVLETPRLILRPLELADADAIQMTFPRWQIVRFMAARIPWPYPESGALAFIRDLALPAMRDGVEWNWTLRPKASPDILIGIVSLQLEEDNSRGFWLAPEWRGRGLMTEAVGVVTDFWFETLGKPVLRAARATANEGSRRIAERTGMRVVWTGERDFVSGRLPAELWEITAEEWRKLKPFREASLAPQDQG